MTRVLKIFHAEKTVQSLCEFCSIDVEFRFVASALKD